MGRKQKHYIEFEPVFTTTMVLFFSKKLTFIQNVKKNTSKGNENEPNYCDSKTYQFSNDSGLGMEIKTSLIVHSRLDI